MGGSIHTDCVVTRSIGANAPIAEIAFIDRGAPNIGSLLAGLRPGVRGILLTEDEPAPRQISRVLDAVGHVATIHIVAHGSPGQVHFSSGTLGAEALAGQAGTLASIGRSLGDDGVLALWSCETGRSGEGRHFTAKLAEITGARVAAASGLVGAAALGGQWILDTVSDESESVRPPIGAAAIEGYAAVLPLRFTGASSSTLTYLSSGENTISGSVTLSGVSGDPGRHSSFTLQLTFTPVGGGAPVTEFLSGIPASDYSGGVLSFTNQSVSDTTAGLTPGETYDVVISGVAHNHFPIIPVSGSEGTVYTMSSGWTSGVCFARGTRIAGPDGDCRIEQLREGDRVLTRGGQVRAVKWVGRRRADAGRDAMTPIRIKAGAVADGIPARDLVVSPEHGIFIDGILIQARQLVNAATIVRDMTFTSIEYFHIEFDAHDVLLAEGLECESYLDTGNRNWFANAEGPVLLRSDLVDDADQVTRETSSCAPFVTDGRVVEPVWRRLAERAVAKGMTVPALLPAGSATDDPDLHAVVGGKRIDAVGCRDGRYVFLLPAPLDAIRLVSRSVFLPDRTPWGDDLRRLGVRVNRMVARRGRADVETIALDGPDLRAGWSVPERAHDRTWRWTCGDATLRLRSDTPVVLEVWAETSLSYPLESAQSARTAA